MTEEQEASKPAPPSISTKVLLVDNPIDIRFLTNSKFYSKLKKYLTKTYNVKCQIAEDEQEQDEELGLHLNFTGENKQNVKNAREFLTRAFTSIKTKTYNNNKKHEKVIGWSTHIYSECILQTIQKIMTSRKIFTIWDKTEMFTGYYIVHYFDDSVQDFGVAIKDIDQILLEEISYVEIIDSISNVKTKIFLQELDKFICDIQKQQQELTLLYCKQPIMKICLSGYKHVVKSVRKQIQQIIRKHQLKTFYIEMDELQRNHLIDNCSQKLKDIESQYKDNDVKLNVRQNLFQAPEYLVGKMKTLINQMIFETFTVTFDRLETEISQSLTANEKSELEQLALINNCQIIKIHSKSTIRICSVPKAMTTTTISRLSQFIIDQSNILCSSESIFHMTSVSNSSIELHTTSSSFTELKADVTVLSSTADAAREGFNINDGNSFVEAKSGRKFLFLQWIPPSISDDIKTKSKLKKQIKKFVSTSLQLIITNVKDDNLETIMFSTNQWEQCSNKKEFALEMINEIQQQLESRVKCRILFVFSKDKQQKELYQEFLTIILAKQNEKDGFIAVSIPVTIVEITLSTSRNNNRIRCQSVINNYIKKTICSTEKLDNQLDLKLWPQHMINAFYQHCLTKSVIPKISINNTEQTVELIGFVRTVDETLEKYRLMTEILKQKVLDVTDSAIQSEPPSTSKKLSRSASKTASATSNDYFNIMFSYCQPDKNICVQLKERLIGEGYLVSTGSNSDQTTPMNKSDLIIIYFSEDYATSNVNEIKHAKSTGKKILLIKPAKLECRGKNNWLHSMTVLQLSYEMFDGSFTIELEEKSFELGYDRLLIELLRYTKPGVVGQPYAKPRAIVHENHDNQKELEESYDDIWYKPRYNGSWFTLDESYACFHELIDKDTLRRLRRLKEQFKVLHREKGKQSVVIKKETTTTADGASDEEKEEADQIVESHPDFVTKIKRGKVGWDIINDRLLEQNITEHKSRYSGWRLYKERQLKMIEEINKSKGKDSELIQKRQIGNEFKTKEEMDKLRELDDPNRAWPSSKKCTPEFLEQKKKNRIEFENLCSTANQVKRKK